MLAFGNNKFTYLLYWLRHGNAEFGNIAVTKVITAVIPRQYRGYGNDGRQKV